MLVEGQFDVSAGPAVLAPERVDLTLPVRVRVAGDPGQHGGAPYPYVPCSGPWPTGPALLAEPFIDAVFGDQVRVEATQLGRDTTGWVSSASDTVVEGQPVNLHVALGNARDDAPIAVTGAHVVIGEVTQQFSRRELLRLPSSIPPQDTAQGMWQLIPQAGVGLADGTREGRTHAVTLELDLTVDGRPVREVLGPELIRVLPRLVSVNNHDPFAQADDFELPDNGAGVVLDVLLNDTTRPDTNESLAVVHEGLPDRGGNTEISQRGSVLLYTPAQGFFGTETFVYRASDGAGRTAEAEARVRVPFMLTLHPGWNLISMPMSLATRGSIADAFADASVVGPAWEWTAEGFRRATDLAAERPYWLYSRSGTATLLHFHGERAEQTAQLGDGWNLFSVVAESMPPRGPDVLGPAWRWDAAAKHYVALEPGQKLKPGEAYWIRMVPSAGRDQSPAPQ